MAEQQDHILVVEDEPITRDQLVSYFEDEGFKQATKDDAEACKASEHLRRY